MIEQEARPVLGDVVREAKVCRGVRVDGEGRFERPPERRTVLGGHENAGGEGDMRTGAAAAGQLDRSRVVSLGLLPGAAHRLGQRLEADQRLVQRTVRVGLVEGQGAVEERLHSRQVGHHLEAVDPAETADPHEAAVQ